MSLKSIASKINQWCQDRVSMRALSNLTDRELGDLGIVRNDIAFVSRKTGGRTLSR